LIRKTSRRALDAFNTWFVSDGGVWQTLLACIVVVVLEQIFPRIDPNHFVVLYVLTVYSGITQPALARAGRVAGEQQELMLAKLEQSLERQQAMEEQMAAVLAALGEDEAAELALLRAQQPTTEPGGTS
jgi:hypothetical protein